jgi:RNA polymerase sigma-70 factor, ECF subfamily
MPELTDEEIAMRVQRGDDQSFGDLMCRYEQKLMRYGGKFLSVDDDIEDKVQEIFMKAFVNLQSFDPGQKFSSWIYRIAHNHYIDALKKKSRSKMSFFNLDIFFPHAVAPETADGETEREDLKKMLDRCLDRLDSKYKEPLILFYFEDLDYKAISDVLQIPVSTVGVRIGRGKATMKKIFKELEEGK